MYAQLPKISLIIKLLQSDCKVIVDAILGFNAYPWAVFVIVDDIKLFLEDYAHIFVAWISHLSDMTAHKSTHQVYSVFRSDIGSVFEIPPTVEKVCTHEQLFM